MKAFSLIAILVAIFSGGNNVYAPANLPVAEKGCLDLTAWSFHNKGFVYLNGEWEFYWNKLLSSDEFVDTRQKKYRNILDNWKEKEKRYGYATYRLKIKIKHPERYAIYIPIIQIAHKLWIDDILVGTNGIVGTSRDNENPEIRNYIKELYLTQGVHNITIHVSNYRFNNGGIRLPISFGMYQDIQDYRELKLFIEALVLGLVAFLIINHLAAFLLNRKNYSNIYFLLVCVCTFIYFFFRCERFLLSFFLNQNWWLLSQIGFIATFSIGPTLFLFNHYIYPIKFSKKLFKPVKIIWGMFVLSVLFLPQFLYVRLVSLYEIFLCLIFLSIFIQAAAALKNKVKGSLVGLLGVVIFIIGLVGEIFYDSRISPVSIFVPCYLFFLLTQSFLTSIKSFQDYKALKKSREEISNQNIELNRLNKLKDEFLSNTTHELKTPLHGIMGIADALKDGIAGELNQKAKSNLSIIINSAQRLSLLVNDILDTQRLKNKDIELNLTSFDLNQVVNIVINISKPLLKNKPVELKNYVHPEDFFVYADSNRLYQIIQNFVSNACKFTESGSIEISAKKKDGMIHITVKDTGIGISNKDQKRIFKRFEQVEHMSAGSGLGLSISKILVEFHGGSVFLESTLGKGSLFTFTIPSGSKPIQNKEIQLPKMLSHVHETQVVPKIIPEQQGQHILVVDDEPVNLKVVSDYLTMSNYKVHQSTSGQGAMKYLEDHKPDLVLLDVMMPEIDGFSVCKKIRKKYSQFEMPVIFLTAKNQITDLVQGFSLGGNDYLTKPFSKNELLARVRCQLAILKAKVRLVNLREFANKISLFRNVDNLVKETFKYVVDDVNVDSAALFCDDKFVDCTHADSQKFIEVYSIQNSLDHHIHKGDDSFIFLRFKEVKNCVIIIKNKTVSTPVDIEYFKALETQAGIIVKNFQNLISDKSFLEDLNIITNIKKHIRFIKRENRQTILYEDKDDKTVYLNSSLKTIESFFSKDLIRVNRFCLINPKKIMWIHKCRYQKSKTDGYEINVDGEKIRLSKNHIDNLSNKQKKEFMNK